MMIRLLLSLLIGVWFIGCERNPIDVINEDEEDDPFGVASGSWIQITGLSAPSVFDLHITEDNHLMAATNAGIYQKPADSDQFKLVALDTISLSAVTTMGSSWIFVSGSEKTSAGNYPVFYSSDNGDNWMIEAFEYPVILLLNTERFGILAGTDRDGVHQWNPDSMRFFKQGGGREVVLSLKEDIAGNRIFMGTFDSGLFYSEDLNRWEQTPLKGRIITSIYIYDTQTILASDWITGLFKSYNGGKDFRSFVLSPLQYTYCLAMSADQKLLAGTLSLGVLKQVSDSLRWNVLDKNLTSKKVTEIITSPAGDIFCIAGEKDVFRLKN